MEPSMKRSIREFDGQIEQGITPAIWAKVTECPVSVSWRILPSNYRRKIRQSKGGRCRLSWNCSCGIKTATRTGKLFFSICSLQVVETARWKVDRSGKTVARSLALSRWLFGEYPFIRPFYSWLRVTNRWYTMVRKFALVSFVEYMIVRETHLCLHSRRAHYIAISMSLM